MYKKSDIEEIKQVLKKENIIYSKYAAIAESLEETLVNAILELEEKMSFPKDQRLKTIEEIEELTAGVIQYIRENNDCIEIPKN